MITEQWLPIEFFKIILFWTIAVELRPATVALNQHMVDLQFLVECQLPNFSSTYDIKFMLLKSVRACSTHIIFTPMPHGFVDEIYSSW